MMKHTIRWFNELTLADVPLVGGKNASLGEMYQNLSQYGVRIPNGFAITASAYQQVLTYNQAWERLHAILDDLDPEDIDALQHKGQQARAVILSCELPPELENAILNAYTKLRREYGDTVSLAVRSSATAEDSPEASFAGQNETYLNIRGDAALLDAYKRCLASNFTDRSIHYKFDHGFDLFKVYLSVVVMKMVRSDKAASGVMFSLDTETGFRDVIFINGAWGLGENIVQGTIDPDSFYVHKPTFQRGFRAVLKRRLGSKEKTMVFAPTELAETQHETVNIETAPQDRQRYCITDDDIMVLADYALRIEAHYSQQAGTYRPMDMEWAKDGDDGHIYIVQARPETVESQKQGVFLEQYHLKQRSAVLLKGQAVGRRIGCGQVRVIKDLTQLREFQPGEVLVADTTTPDWEPVMKIAAAIITNRGGRTCHAAIVSRELGKPAIVGATAATQVLKNGQAVTVSCAEGETGYVYDGELDFEVERTDLSHLPQPQTEIMMNLGNPEQAFGLAALPVAGIGLARMEFIINEFIKAHPMAIRHPDRVDAETRQRIDKLSAAFDSPESFFIKTLSEGVATLAAAVYPKPCIVRMSDFKSNEYAALLGGAFFEPSEANPMLGFRGAARYIHPDYTEGFALECQAMKRARDEMGLDNIKLMIPFCRRIEEAKAVLEMMQAQGLARGVNGLEIYMMCEIPNNVILIDEFAKLFDGFSIGSNDLTQLTLGVDRDSSMVAQSFDERDPGVKQMIRLAIEGAKRNQRHSGLCGQAPSDYPEMAEFLVKAGIDSMSLNPDSVLTTLRQVLSLEQQMK